MLIQYQLEFFKIGNDLLTIEIVGLFILQKVAGKNYLKRKIFIVILQY